MHQISRDTLKTLGEETVLVKYLRNTQPKQSASTLKLVEYNPRSNCT